MDGGKKGRRVDGGKRKGGGATGRTDGAWSVFLLGESCFAVGPHVKVANGGAGRGRLGSAWELGRRWRFQGQRGGKGEGEEE